jgi:hypothetical protein
MPVNGRSATLNFNASSTSYPEPVESRWRTSHLTPHLFHRIFEHSWLWEVRTRPSFPRKNPWRGVKSFASLWLIP